MFSGIATQESLSENPNLYAKIGTALIALVFVFVIGMVVYTHHNMQRIHEDWNNYRELTQQKDQMIATLYREMGYDGLIHNFKNYLLRHTDHYKSEFLRHADEIEEIAQQHLQDPQTTEEERKSFIFLLQTTKQYKEKLPEIDQGYRDNKPLSEIDRLVQIDDTSAIRGLENIRNVVKSQEELVFERSMKLQKTISSINLASLILLPFLLIAGFFKHSILSLLAHYITLQGNAERRLKAILDNTLEGMITANEDGVIEEFNKACEAMFGWSKEEIVGQNLNILMTGQHKAQHDDYIQKYRDGGSAKLIGQPREFEVVRKDNSKFFVEIALAEVIESNQRYFTGIVRDITERRERDIALQQYKEQTQILVQAIESCQVGITLADPSQKDLPLTFVNRAFEEISGYSRDEILGKNCRFLQGKRTEQEHVDVMREGITEEKPINTDLLNYRKDGTPFWNNIQISPVYGENGELKAYVGTQKDITELKEAQNRILQERDFSAHIINYAPSLVVGLRPDGTTNFINQSALSTIEYDEKDVIGKNWWKLLYPKDAGQVEQLLDFIEKEGQQQAEIKDYEMTLTSKTGKERLIAWTSLNQFDHEGNVVQIIGIGTDLTKEREQMRLEQERHKLESLGTMAGGIAHEINNALLPIILLAEDYQLKHKDSDDDTQKDLDTIVEYALHARSIVEDVLLYSRQADRETEALDIYAIFEQALKFSRDFLPSTILIEETVDKALADKCICVNKTGFIQIISNLLNNASYAMNGSGDIHIDLCNTEIESNEGGLQKGGYLKIVIRDTGAGIPKEKIDNIFDPFFTTKAEGEGSGLGLSVVYGFIKEWDGDISVASEENAGTTFTLLLPLVKKH